MYGQIHKKLRQLLQKTITPITGRKVACVIVGENCVLEGYNVERNEKSILHAERFALAQAPRGLRVRDIHLIAGGKVVNVKNAVPCGCCLSLLQGYCSGKSKVIFHFPKEEKTITFYFEDLVKETYKEFKTILRVSGNIVEFLKQHTPLTLVDRNLVCNLLLQIRTVMLANSVETYQVFLTGSSSGRGGFKSQLANRIIGVCYWDLDLVIIVPKGIPDYFDHSIKEMYQASLQELGFSSSKISSEEQPSYRLEAGQRQKKGFCFRKVYWRRGELKEVPFLGYRKSKTKPSVIDVSVGTELESTMTINYLQKNLYVRLV